MSFPSASSASLARFRAGQAAAAMLRASVAALAARTGATLPGIRLATVSAVLAAGAVALFCAAAAAAAPDPLGEWTVTPVPLDPGWWTSELEDVSGTGPDDAWAVGQFKTLGPQWQIETFTLAMHWDGNAWTHVPTPSPAPWPGGTNASLHAVVAVAPDDIWSGGERVGDAGGLSVGPWLYVQHWDGRAWHEVPVPEPPGGVSINFSGTRVLDALAFGPDEVWFAGQWGEPNEVGSVTWRPLALRWDGSDLELLPTPAPLDGAYGFKSVHLAAAGPDDLWAVCARVDGGMTTRNVVQRWDGSSWSDAGAPDSSPAHTLDAIAVAGPDDVWVFGDVPLTGETVALHFDGRSWTEVSDPPLAWAAKALSPGAIWVGGNDVALFDGTTAVEVTFDGVEPARVFGLESVPGGGLWAVGRAQTPGNAAWAARRSALSAASPWTALPGGVPGGVGQPGLAGEGTLEADAPARMSIGGAPPSAGAAIVVGLTRIDAPFKGGTLVPSPDIIVTGLLTDFAGDWETDFTWPPGVPVGTSIWFQAWVPNAAAPAGFCASGGLQATQP